MLSWAVTLRSTLRRTRKSHAIRLFRAPSFTSSVSSYPPVSPFPIFRTFFQVPYPASPLFAILTKTPGVWGYSSHFGTARAVLPTGTPYIIQVLSFHVLAQSFALFCIRKKINSFVFKQFRTLWQKHPGWGGASLHFLDVWTLERSDAPFASRMGLRDVPPSVPLQPNAFGATIRKGTRFLRDPGKQLRSSRCLRIVSGHRELSIDVSDRRPRFGRGCEPIVLRSHLQEGLGRPF